MRRREFLRSTATSAVAASSASGILGANNRVRVGLIGCGGRGMAVARLMRQVPDVEFAAVCDVYEPHAARARDWAGGTCEAYGDFRKLLERRDVDAVIIATPDHWH